MSYWVTLVDLQTESPAKVAKHAEGGTAVVGGTTLAELNVTYNYSPHFYRYLDPASGLRWLAGKRASETVERLDLAVAKLGVEKNENYWMATTGNAGAALATLLAWAREYPDGIWEVT